MDDRELAARAARGDPDAFAALVAAYQTLAFRAAYYTLGDAVEAEEAVQEALLKAHAALGRFRPGAPFRPWLLRIVATTALNRARSRTRRATLAARAAALTPNDNWPSPEAALLAAEDAAEVLAALNRLAPDDRLALTQRYFLDCPIDELATICGCSERAMRSRLARALARLRRELERAAHAASTPPAALEARHD
jgi:RNA polymerase sigma-70 factor (ECF subfamily)